MSRVIILFLIPVFSSATLLGQAKASSDSSYIIFLNQQIDNYVVQKNLDALDTLYAGDFVFSHGSGKVEGKQGWLATVRRTTYPIRQHDSVRVEMHPGLAIVKGKMAIQRLDKDKTASYHLRYLRVYTLRNKRWQLISHSTTHEQHD